MKVSARPLWKISALTRPEAEEAVSELFERVLGQTPNSHTRLRTGTTTVTAYFDHKPHWPQLQPALSAGLRQIRACGLHLGSGRLSLRPMPREDWAESWKRHFKPLAIGRALLIKPSWSPRQPRAGQQLIVLDPGLSFGTGQHPTTGFCLHQLAAHQPQGGARSLLDAGTGSGILAIAAAKLGYSPIDAFDFDPEAVRIAKLNAHSNGVGRHIRFSRQDVTRLPGRSPRQYEVVCANLISNLLLAQKERLLARLAPQGLLVLAGILKTEFGQVQKAYEAAGLRLVASKVEKEWRSGSFQRP